MSSAGLSPAVKRLAVVVVLGAFMSILDTTIVNVALETLSRDLDAPLDEVQWVATAYLLALAAVIPVTAWAAGASARAALHLVARALHGGLGAVRPGLERRVARRLPGPAGHRRRDDHARRPDGDGADRRPAEHGPGHGGHRRADRHGARAGPVLGGILVQELSWEWIFFVNVPVGIVAVLAAQRLFPEEAPEPAGRLDLTGLALLATGCR
jgi:MFS family permease